LTVSEVAAALGMGKSAVRKAIKRGTMKATIVAEGPNSAAPRAAGTLDGYYDVAPEEVERYRTQSRQKQKEVK
jgi:hypothetical protein